MILWIVLWSSLSWGQVAEYRGYADVNQVLGDRLLERGQELELGRYVGQTYDFLIPNLLDLVGSFKSFSLSERIKNGVPNSLNMLLWHMFLSGLASDMGRLCEGEMNWPFNVRTQATLKKFCLWPNDELKSDDALNELWFLLMGFDAPLSEVQEWKNFVRAGELDEYSGAEAVEWLSLSVLMSPYLLLGR